MAEVAVGASYYLKRAQDAELLDFGTQSVFHCKSSSRKRKKMTIEFRNPALINLTTGNLSFVKTNKLVVVVSTWQSNVHTLMSKTQVLSMRRVYLSSKFLLTFQNITKAAFLEIPKRSSHNQYLPIQSPAIFKSEIGLVEEMSFQ